MNEINILLCLVVPLYVTIHSMDFLASYARVAGYFYDMNSFGYSLQNSFLAYSRVFNMMLLPLIGYLIDNNLNSSSFFIACISSLYVCGVSSFYIFHKSNKIVNVFSRRISSRVGVENKEITLSYMWFGSVDFKSFLLGVFIYTINGISILLTFYFATRFTDHQVMITQMSGVITAFATFVLTIKLDPMLSLKIEKKDDFPNSHRSILLARITSCFVTSPLIFTVIHLLV